MSKNLKKLFILGASTAFLAGCAATADKTPAKAAEAPKPAVTQEAAIPVTVQAKSPEKAPLAEVKSVPPISTTATVTETVKPAEPAKPIPAAQPSAPKITTLKGKGLFDFNKSTLREDAKAELDKNVIGNKGNVAKVTSVNIDGHTDRIGSHEHNQRLSEKRAEAIKAYLVGKGVPADNINTNGFGKTQPATGVAKCDDALARPDLINCLQPHRRVEVELKGEAK